MRIDPDLVWIAAAAAVLILPGLGASAYHRMRERHTPSLRAQLHRLREHLR